MFHQAKPHRSMILPTTQWTVKSGLSLKYSCLPILEARLFCLLLSLIWHEFSTAKITSLNVSLSNIFLKFSELAVLDKNEQPFSNKFGATASAIVTEFLCPDEIACMPLEQLIDFICEKGKSRFSNPENTAKLLQKACRDSYRLDKALYDPLNVTIAASFNCISSLEKQIKELDKAILKAVKGLSSNEYQCLLSIKGIGPVFAARHYC